MKKNNIIVYIICFSILFSISINSYALGETLGGAEFDPSEEITASQGNQTVQDMPSAAPVVPANPNVSVGTVLEGVNQILNAVIGIGTITQWLVGNGTGNTNQQSMYGYTYTNMVNIRALLQGFQTWFNPSTGNLGSAIISLQNTVSNINNMLARLNNVNYSSTLTTINNNITSLNTKLTTIGSDTSFIKSDTNLIRTYLSSLQTSVSSIQSNVNTSNTHLSNISANVIDIEDDVESIDSKISTSNSSLSSIDNKLTSLGSVTSNVSSILSSVGYNFASTLATSLDNISDNQDTQEGTLEDISDKLDDIIDVISNPADQQVTNNQKNNVNIIIPTFFTGISTDTSIGPSDWTNFGNILGKIRNFLSSGISLAGFSAALDEAADEGTMFFSQEVVDDLYNSDYLGVYVP